MKSKILESIGVDPAYILIIMLLLIALLFVLLISINMKYNRLKVTYNSFMKGKDGKTLEKSFLEKFKEIDDTVGMVKKNRQDIKNIYRKMEECYNKVGIVKYDAFDEMGGKLSFALTLLNNNNDGYIINMLHSTDGCYAYIKEIVKGQSYIELGEEEIESLDKAIYHETNGLNIEGMNK